MTERPSGTITFLFTDIEGSSRLWEQHPETMGRALARHDFIVRSTAEAHSGFVFKTMGDAFCVAFDRAVDALAAALDAQRALLSEEWSETGPIRVRMALHTGAVEHRDGDYFGPALNRVSRLLSTAHGGQTVLSLPTEELVRDALADGVTLRDLGERRLRDLNRPEHIFQLVARDLPTEFPALRSLEAVPNNLPVQLTSFIGREREMTEVKRLLNTTHLLTLKGTGGTGKTRLSLQTAADILENFPDGVWFVEFATLSDPELVAETVAGAVGVREEPEHSLSKTLTNFLRDKSVLLIFDNCEHLIAAIARLSETLLRSCPKLRILASSREALGIVGETTFAVPPLSLPDHWRNLVRGEHFAAELSQFEAVRLFVDRVGAVKPGFTLNAGNAEAVAKICWRLDGIPLAIELAAARVKVLSTLQIAERLDDMFRLLTGGSRTAMPRQQTLRALIDWSYDLLSDPERMLLRRLAVFARGRTLGAAEAVCAGDGVEPWEVLDLLTQLVDKSLVTVERDQWGESRYFILESVWDYCQEKLDAAGETESIRRRHLDFFLQLAERAEPKLFGPEQTEWLDRVELERGNFRVALEASAELAGCVDAGLRMATALTRYWEVRSHLREAREHFGTLLSHPDSAARTLVRAKALVGAGRVAWCQDDNVAAFAYFEEAIAIFRQQNDKLNIGLASSYLGFVARSEQRTELAQSLFNESLALGEESADPRLIAIAQSGLGTLANDAGDTLKARTLKQLSLDTYRQTGDKWVIGLLVWSLGNVAAAQGDHAAAEAYYRDTLKTAQELRNKWIMPYILEGFGDIAMLHRDADRAARLFGAADGMRAQLGLVMPPAERVQHTRSVSAIRAALPEADLNAAWQEGRRFTLDQAVAFALDRDSTGIQGG